MFRDHRKGVIYSNPEGFGEVFPKLFSLIDIIKETKEERETKPQGGKKWQIHSDNEHNSIPNPISARNRNE